MPFPVFLAWVEVLSPIASTVCLNIGADKADTTKRAKTNKNLILILKFVFSICFPMYSALIPH